MNDLLRRLLFLPPEASTFAPDVDRLHLLVIAVTLLGATAIALFAALYAVRYRHDRARRPTASRRTTRRVELVLTFLTLAFFLAVWVVGFRQYVRMTRPPADALVVYATGKQWMWKFSHEEGPAELGELTVPVGRPVVVVLTSRDVIHSFYVPAFRIKQDAVPGRYVTTWFEATAEGTYDLFCAEYCGTEHAAMQAKVRVLSPTAYAAWLAGARAADPRSLAERGRDVAARQQCLACHTIDGQSHVGPTWRGLFGARVALADGRTVIADEAYLTRSMMLPNDELVAGFATRMPSYFGRLDAGETAALVAYIRALGGPDTAVAVDAPPPASGPLAADGGSAP